MAISIVRFRHQHLVFWGALQSDQVQVLDVSDNTTAGLIALGYHGVRKLIETSKITHRFEEIELLSPITAPTKVLCQGANYRQHMIDSGINPDDKHFNMLFTKSTASITGPTGTIIKPSNVQLLDYEVELTLVLGKSTCGPVNVTDENIHEYVAGICIGNDVSARDIQIPQMQFHKGKSYRTFCPLGPILCLLDKHEMHYLNDLKLTLAVNGEVRQCDTTANIVFKPAETLSEYSHIHDFDIGDVLMTGTPSGCALGLPSAPLVKLFGLLPETLKWSLFVKGQARRKNYLKVGDQVESMIVSGDGNINLGIQRHTISAEA